MTTKHRRITKELESFTKNDEENSHLHAELINCDNLFEWYASIKGPNDSVYENSIFELHIKLSKRYPMYAPKITMLTPIFHPNIGLKGRIKLKELKWDQWSPSMTIKRTLEMIYQLLKDPSYDYDTHFVFKLF